MASTMLALDLDQRIPPATSPSPATPQASSSSPSPAASSPSSTPSPSGTYEDCAGSTLARAGGPVFLMALAAFAVTWYTVLAITIELGGLANSNQAATSQP